MFLWTPQNNGISTSFTCIGRLKLGCESQMLLLSLFSDLFELTKNLAHIICLCRKPIFRLNIHVNFSLLNRWICFIPIHEIIHFLVTFYFYILYINGEFKKILEMKLINHGLQLRLKSLRDFLLLF